MWQKIKCFIRWHGRLDVIQTFGAAQHVGCPYCRTEYAIHHRMQAFVPWSPAFDDLYQRMGYDTDRATSRWRTALGEKKDD